MLLPVRTRGEWPKDAASDGRLRRIAASPSLGSGLSDPGDPLAPEIVELTGLTDDMVANRKIDRDELGAFV